MASYSYGGAPIPYSFNYIPLYDKHRKTWCQTLCRNFNS